MKRNSRRMPIQITTTRTFGVLQEALWQQPIELVQLVAAYRGCCDQPVGDGKALLSCSSCRTTTCLACANPFEYELRTTQDQSLMRLTCHLCSHPLPFASLWAALLSRRVWFLTGTEQERRRLHKALLKRVELDGFVVTSPPRAMGSLYFKHRLAPEGHEHEKHWGITSHEDPEYWIAELVIRCESVPLRFATKTRNNCAQLGMRAILSRFVLRCEDIRNSTPISCC